MERLRPSEEETQVKRGVNLKELIRDASERHRGKPGPSVSPRVLWLSEVIETEKFWQSLNTHLADDISDRQSAGGVFTKKSGQEKIGQYTWHQCFSSLDHFLQEFDMRGTEFIFRDFQPENDNKELFRLIDGTRELVLDKYPRLRRLYWDDYKEALESQAFWRGLIADLSNISEPVAPESFFGFPHQIAYGKNSEERDKTALERVLRKQFISRKGQPGKKEKSIQYHNLAQIIRDIFDEDPRTFLLKYVPISQNWILNDAISQAKKLLSEKVLPTRPLSEQIKKISTQEFRKIIESAEFWRDFKKDIENHRNSKNTAAYSLAYFLRHYDMGENEITPGKYGTYMRLTTADMKSTKNLRRKSVKASRKLVNYLMWNFDPSEEIKEYVVQVKALCAEMFPLDCLYVVLQTPEFWQMFLDDINKSMGENRLYSFLRYFSSENPTCDGRKHKKGKAKYQRFLHRAYHEKKEFKNLLSLIGIEDVTDYKDGLSNLFWHTCPEQAGYLLQRKFPVDFNPRRRQEKLQQLSLLNSAKNVISRLKKSKQDSTEIKFETRKEAEEFRKKIWSVSRILKVKIKSSLTGSKLEIVLGSRLVVPMSNRKDLEYSIKCMRLAGQLSNKEIARELGVEDYTVEWVVRKLIKAGEIPSRR